MPSRPTHRRDKTIAAAQPAEVGAVAQALGITSAGFGIGLMVLTLAGAVDGYAAIGFYDVIIGGMFVAFSYKAVTFGYAVATGRQTLNGEWA